MESWNQVIHSALLGTEKKTLRKEEVDEYLAENLDLIAAQIADREEAFLQAASLVYNARQCGLYHLRKRPFFCRRQKRKKRLMHRLPHMQCFLIFSIPVAQHCSSFGWSNAEKPIESLNLIFSLTC